MNIQNVQEIIKETNLNKSKKINLHGYKLDSWPEELFNLDFIEVLYLSKNNLKTIPKEILKLKKLRYLNLNYNLISEIPEFISELGQITDLFLSNNIITNFPIIIFKLNHLKTISLSFNRISELPTNFSKSKNIKEIILENNEIKELPRKFIESTSLNSLILNNNPIISPPLEIVSKSLPAIKNYFESLDEFKDIYKIFEAKLLIVGEGFVGKTCLMKKLINPKLTNIKDITTTEGIEINQYYIKTKQVKNFRVNIWDFGGQEIYHATHQFFLTKRSLYLLVWTARKDDNITSFDYWLNVIKLLSDNAPVIIVLNKIDERIKMIDEREIQTKFPNIKFFHKVSAKTNEGLKELENIIVSEIEKLPHIGETVPKVWIDIRKYLENTNKNFITKFEYIAICKKFNLSEEKALFLSQYYHDLGVFLHFQDNDILDRIIFLKPEWATNAVYKVVDTKEIQKKHGRFKLENLKKIWKDYDDNNYIHLIELMKKFELCFKFDKETYIAPVLLSEQKAQNAIDWDNNENLLFEYHYDFMPSGIITRFIVRNSDLIEKNIIWKNGLIIIRKETYDSKRGSSAKVYETKALIEAKPLDRKVRIKIKGDNKNMLLSIIRREFDYIHKTLNNPSVKEMIPCSCKACNQSEDKIFFDYGIIKIYLENNENYIFCPNGCERVLISNLLEGINNLAFNQGNNGINIGNINITNSNANFADIINSK